MTIYIGDCLTWLKKLPSASVHCIVTSPPYYFVRDYGVSGQIGLERTPNEFIEKLVAVFREARRVLRPDGTCWVNMGDTYSAGGRGHDTPKQQSNKGTGIGEVTGRFDVPGYAPKQLLMIPARLALALQADGWWLRSDIIWHKPNPMPESVTDRPTKSHEHIFLLAKNPTYWYDAEAIREPHAVEKTEYSSGQKFGYARKANPNDNCTNEAVNGAVNALGRNKRDVWTINTEASGVAHFATMPTELAETCIRAGCPENVCSECGAGYVAIVEAKGGTIGKGWTDHTADLTKGMSATGGDLSARTDTNGNPYTRTLKGYAPSCTCNAATDNGIVLDPFGGAGTTAIAAIHSGRKYQLIELNIKYAGIAQQRIAAYNPFQATVLPDGMKQLSLFEGIA